MVVAFPGSGAGKRGGKPQSVSQATSFGRFCRPFQPETASASARAQFRPARLEIVVPGYAAQARRRGAARGRGQQQSGRGGAPRRGGRPLDLRRIPRGREARRRRLAAPGEAAPRLPGAPRALVASPPPLSARAHSRPSPPAAARRSPPPTRASSPRCAPRGSPRRASARSAPPTSAAARPPSTPSSSRRAASPSSASRASPTRRAPRTWSCSGRTSPARVRAVAGSWVGTAGGASGGFWALRPARALL